MSSSPFVNEDIKKYMKKFNIENLINRTVNGLLKDLPQDPYAFLIGEFQKLASADIRILGVEGVQVISGDGFPCIRLKVTVSFMNKESTFMIANPFGILSDEGMLYDEDRLGGKGMHKGIKFISDKIAQKIKGYKCKQQTEIDKDLQAILHQNNNLGLYQINSVSYMIPLVQAHIQSKPLYSVFEEISEDHSKKAIKMIVNCLHGGKAIGSKCKVFKYYIIGKAIHDPYMAQTILQAVRKAIVSGKGGEAALKLSPDSTFVCPLDTIMDNLKIVEDAINSCNAKDQFSIGLSWMADTLFSNDTKKYQLENPKTPFDNDQMIDYLIKLLTDKPIIQYLEDPLAFSQKAAWKKLITKIKETEAIKTVKIGSRNGKLFNLLDPNFKNHLTDVSIHETADTHPESTEESRKASNLHKFSLDFVQVRAFQLKTLTNLVRAYKELKKTNTELIIQDNAYETYDSTLIDLCYGLNCFSSLGSIAKFDRISKLNRVKEIISQTQLK